MIKQCLSAKFSIVVAHARKRNEGLGDLLVIQQAYAETQLDLVDPIGFREAREQLLVGGGRVSVLLGVKQRGRS